MHVGVVASILRLLRIILICLLLIRRILSITRISLWRSLL